MSKDPRKEIDDFLSEVLSKPPQRPSTPPAKVERTVEKDGAGTIFKETKTEFIDLEDTEALKQRFAEINNDMEHMVTSIGLLMTAFALMESGMSKLDGSWPEPPDHTKADWEMAANMVSQATELVGKLTTAEIRIAEISGNGNLKDMAKDFMEGGKYFEAN